MHLGILVVACMVPLLIFAAIMMVLLEKQKRASVERGLRDTARALSVAVDNQLIASVSTLQALAAFDRPDAMNLERFHVQAKRVLATQPGWLYVALHSGTGKQLISAAHPFGAPLPPTGNVKMVSQALDTGAVVISNLFGGPVLKVPGRDRPCPSFVTGSSRTFWVRGWMSPPWAVSCPRASFPRSGSAAIKPHENTFRCADPRASRIPRPLGRTGAHRSEPPVRGLHLGATS